MQSILCIKVELANENYCTEYEIKLEPIIFNTDINNDIINIILNGYNLLT